MADGKLRKTSPTIHRCEICGKVNKARLLLGAWRTKVTHSVKCPSCVRTSEYFSIHRKSLNIRGVTRENDHSSAQFAICDSHRKEHSKRTTEFTQVRHYFISKQKGFLSCVCIFLTAFFQGSARLCVLGNVERHSRPHLLRNCTRKRIPVNVPSYADSVECPLWRGLVLMLSIQTHIKAV